MHTADGHNNTANFGIRTRDAKLFFYYGCDYTDVHNGRRVKGRDGNRFWKSTPPGWEFYDLRVDPHEMHNRYGDPAYRATIAALKTELQRLRADIGDTDEDHPRIRRIIEAHWND